MKSAILLILLSIISLKVYCDDTVANYSESEIILKTSTGDICGTLTLPDLGTTFPMVLMIAGSGPTDRDGNQQMGMKPNTYRMIAHTLASQGIASVRYDKRGIGKSRPAMTNEADLRFDTYVNDVADWISLLRQDNRFKYILVLGHSEGSLIGMLALQKILVDGFISVAGAGRPADVIIIEQIRVQTEKQAPVIFQDTRNYIDSLKHGKMVKNVNPLLMSLFRPSIQPYMISWFKYDPALEMGKITIPVLIIQGKNDIQVMEEDARLLAAANPHAKLVLIEKMNHILKEAGTDRQANIATYSNSELPVMQLCLDEIIAFVKKLCI